MKGQNYQQPLSPKMNIEDFEVASDENKSVLSQQSSIFKKCKSGVIGPDRQSMVLFDVKKSLLSNKVDTPRSQSQINNSQENALFESQSEESFIFQQSRTHRHQFSRRQPKSGIRSHTKLTNLKDLLRLFRINIEDDNMFEINGHTYEIDTNEFLKSLQATNLFQVAALHDGSPIIQQEESSNISPDNFRETGFSQLQTRTIERQSNVLEIQLLPLESYNSKKQVSLEDKETQIVQNDFFEGSFATSDDIKLFNQNSQNQTVTNSQKEVTKKFSQQLSFNNDILVTQKSNLDEDFRPSITQEIPILKRFNTVGDPTIKRKSEKSQQEINKINQEKKNLEVKLQETQKQLDNLNQLDAKLHLAFLFATPLVIRCQGGYGKDNFTPMPLLEFKKEFKEIENSIKETHKHIKIKKTQATVENLTQTLAQNPLALHFTGHGIQNNLKSLGRDYHLKKNDGNFLLFESEDGEGELVSERQLSEFIKQSNTKLEFVFVASCNSEPVGKIFLNSGAKHVICVKDGQQIADEAVITFSKSFYHSVFSQSMSICSAYSMAQSQVEVKFGKGESNKFKLLKQEPANAKPKSTNVSNSLMPTLDLDPEDLLDFDDFDFKLKVEDEHQCKVFGPLKDGEIEYIDIVARFRNFPAKVDDFIGRQIEMHEIIKNACSHRLVNIIGLPGIGKTSLSKNAVHYIADRKIFKSGIIFMPAKGFISCDLFLKKLLLNFVADFKLGPAEQQLVKEGNTEALLQISLSYLKTTEEKLIIIFDNVEDLLYYDKLAFRNLINDLLVTCPLLHIMMTSRTTLGTLQDIQEKIVVLNELNIIYTVKLFISRSRDISDEEIKELLACESEKNMGKETKAVTNINDHHLFKLLGGNPHAITLAAPILIKMKLKDLYLLLNSKEMHDVLKVDGITDSTVASLRLSLEASIKMLVRDDKDSLQFFFLIGMLPGGVSGDDLEQIWGTDWNKCVDNLINLSLLQKKESDNDKKEKYILPPFMNNYAEAKICEEDRITFQNDICKYYSKACKKILDQNGRISKNKDQGEINIEVNDGLLKLETNIWAAIYRLVDSPVLINQQEDEEIDISSRSEVLTAEASTRLKRFSTLLDKDNKSSFSKMSTLRQSILNFEQKKPVVKTKTLSSDFSDSQIDSQNNSSKQSPLNIKDIKDEKRRNSIGGNPMITSNALMSLLSKGVQENLNKQKTLFQNQNLEKIEEQSNDSFAEDSSEENDNSKDHSSDSFDKNQDEDEYDFAKLQDVIRNSIVNFSRPTNSRIILSTIKAAPTATSTFKRSGTLAFTKQTSTKSIAKEKEMHYAEKLILYYAMNLYLQHENDNCIHLILNYGLKIKGCQLFEANLKRIYALILHNKGELDNSIKVFLEAKEIYNTINCAYGLAVCNFSIGYVYFTQVIETTQKSEVDQLYKKAKINLETSLKAYAEVNHSIGEALCHKILSDIFIKLNNQTQVKTHQEQFKKLNKYFNNYKNSPFISRQHGQEISLMSELTMQKFSKDLFADVQVFKKKKSAKESMLQPIKSYFQNTIINAAAEQNGPFEKIQFNNEEQQNSKKIDTKSATLEVVNEEFDDIQQTPSHQKHLQLERMIGNQISPGVTNRPSNILNKQTTIKKGTTIKNELITKNLNTIKKKTK